MDCIEWWSHKNADGYGVIHTAEARRTGLRMAHRMIYEECFGEIPSGTQIDHICCNRSCVNPAHLQPVTLQENLRLAKERRTHCKNGHERTAENLYVTPQGTYKCRTCQSNARIKYRRK